MRGVLVCMLAACSFRPGTSSLEDDAPGASVDTPPMIAPCTLASGGMPVDASPPFIGGAGGDVRAGAACAPGELPIGLGFDVSEGGISAHANQIAMVNLHVRCGRIARDATGAWSTTPQERIDSAGGMGGNCSDYFPTVVANEVVCPAGSVLVGVTGNRLDDTLYNTVGIQCAALGLDGQLLGKTELPIANTGTNQNQPMTATCPADTAVAAFAIKSGCGHDQLAPRCAAVTCN